MTKYAILLQNGEWASVGGRRLTFTRYVDAFNARTYWYGGRVVEIEA